MGRKVYLWKVQYTVDKSGEGSRHCKSFVGEEKGERKRQTSLKVARWVVNKPGGASAGGQKRKVCG